MLGWKAESMLSSVDVAIALDYGTSYMSLPGVKVASQKNSAASAML